uniref:Actin maturation protease n=1 Tax=Crassostrea virginica TaxID=6565 RepID=A0A8B8E3C6_CRAVI|nr:UPF0692 protein C19orf54 homolog [Crassostrea virginica]
MSLTNSAPAPLAPPPPNMTTLKSISLKNIVGAALMIAQEPSSSIKEQLRKKLKVTIEKDIPNLPSKILLSSNFFVNPIMQDGPCCGVVALAMASQMLSNKEITAPHVLQSSQNLGLSLQGELFSAYDMAKLAEEMLGCTSAVLDMRDSNSKDILLKHLASNHPVLVPYDGDANNSPCLKNGHKAHWALLTGFLVSLEKSIKLDNEGITGDTELHSLHHLTPAKSRELNNQIRAASDVFVYGVQGKSRNIGLWSLQSLLASNANLEEVDPRREIETGQFIIPQEGIQRALCNRVVILHD